MHNRNFSLGEILRKQLYHSTVAVTQDGVLYRVYGKNGGKINLFNVCF